MNWRATNEKQQEALWRVFLMLVIRTGLVSRGMVATVVLKAEPEDAALGGRPAVLGVARRSPPGHAGVACAWPKPSDGCSFSTRVRLGN
jgi:hypothetical protein